MTSTTVRDITEVWEEFRERTWLESNNESTPVYILDKKVRSTKRDTSSHGKVQSFGAMHVTEWRSNTYSIH